MTLRSLRKDVSIRLGTLINVRVNLYGAVESDKDTALHTLCNQGHEPVRIKQKLECPECHSTEREAFVKGAQVGEKYVVVDPDAISGELDEAIKNEICITAHARTDVEALTLPGSKVYYLGPTPKANQDDAYTMIREIVKAASDDTTLVTVFALRSKPSLFTLSVYNDTLVLSERTWPEDVRETPELKPIDASVADQYASDAFVEMAKATLKPFYADFDPANYIDQTKEQRKAALAAANGEVVVLPKQKVAAAPLSPLDLLNANLAAINAGIAS